MRIQIHRIFNLFLLFLLVSAYSVNAQTKAEVLIVLGSDTAIWDGMSTNRYNNYYNQALYTDPADNTYEVMSSAFRSNLKDSYGTTMKLTWWMMAGNIFRYATNNNMPYPNIMTMYLMKKYHMEGIEEFGDELTLHYHTFLWSDFNNDGISYWNQAKSFMDCFDDFNFTLAQFLLEEEVFPVSFRSGWHYMDNEWQSYLNELLPYSMHNAYPQKKTDWTEPSNNVIDWSMAPSEWIPYHPSVDNYQVPGPSKGWNLRSKHLGSSISQNVFEDMFKEADKGVTQVACIWGHLPEDDFNDNLVRINELLHEADQKYPYVKFRYCTAIEAMQLWLGTDDKTAPELTIEEINRGDGLYYRISTDEPIYQRVPFVAVKDIYENFDLVKCRYISPQVWETAEPVSGSLTAKIGFAVSDYYGNQTIEIKRFYPDDIYVDNQDEGYVEVSGQWTSGQDAAWGTDSRRVLIQPGDSVRVKFIPEIKKSGYYNILVQSPGGDNSVSELAYSIYSDGKLLKKVIQTESLPDKEWHYVATVELTEGSNNLLGIVSGESGKVLNTDVAKFSPLVVEKSVSVNSNLIDLQSVSEFDTTWFDLDLSNRGYESLTVSAIETIKGNIKFSQSFPATIDPMSSMQIPMYIYSEERGSFSDTLVIYSDDPEHSILKVTVNVLIQSYFITMDNDEPGYTETGNWNTSVTQAHGNSSRYSVLSEPAGTRADFDFVLPKAGIYAAEYIVPKTVNSANSALYTVSVNGRDIDSFHVDQNLDSGGWVFLGEYNFPSGVPVTISVINDKTSTEGAVLRADAITLNLIEEITEVEDFRPVVNSFKLYQNYPNPFSARGGSTYGGNPGTTIEYKLPAFQKSSGINQIASSAGNQVLVTLKVYDILGREVAQLVNREQRAGTYKVVFDAAELPSGVYFYTLTAGKFQETKKLILMK